MTTRTLIVVGLLAAAASEAQAQVQPAPASKGYASVNFGVQPSSRTININNSFPIYGETATLTTTQEVGGGAIFDIAGGYRVRKDIGVGIGFSTFSDSGSSTGSVSIPDPLVFNRPATVPLNQEGLDHSEKSVHILATWFYPVTNEFDIAISIGPSIVNVKQELVSSVNVPAQTQTATPIVSSEKETGVGLFIGVDGTYLFTRNIGAGGFLRYAGASVDLPSAPDLSVGGFQLGAGLRVRF